MLIYSATCPTRERRFVELEVPGKIYASMGANNQWIAHVQGLAIKHDVPERVRGDMQMVWRVRDDTITLRWEWDEYTFAGEISQ